MSEQIMAFLHGLFFLGSWSAVFIRFMPWHIPHMMSAFVLGIFLAVALMVIVISFIVPEGENETPHSFKLLHKCNPFALGFTLVSLGIKLSAKVILWVIARD